MKTIKTQNKELIVVEVPDIELYSNTNERLFWDYYKKDNPDNNQEYLILGKLSELSEEECGRLVKSKPHRHSDYDLYYNYKLNLYSFGSSKESLISLLQSEDVDTNKNLLIVEVL